MVQSMSVYENAALSRSTYEQYPFLSEEEFAELCHHLHNTYCKATLGPKRRRWRLSVHSALATSMPTDGSCSTFVQITRPLEDVAHDEELASKLNNMFIGPLPQDGDAIADETIMKIEEDDAERLPRSPAGTSQGIVQYEIHLHPTYRVPCLWFSLRHLPAGEPAFDPDTVFRRLVPDQYKDTLRGMGPTAALSADHHPITGLPSFFVHPCLVGDAMSDIDCSKQQYLMVWLGLVGACVGLWVPREMAMDN